jgi:hypothetical protein
MFARRAVFFCSTIADAGTLNEPGATKIAPWIVVPSALGIIVPSALVVRCSQARNSLSDRRERGSFC